MIKEMKPLKKFLQMLFAGLAMDGQQPTNRKKIRIALFKQNIKNTVRVML